MKHNLIRQTVFPIITALIWGTAFVAQAMGAGHVDAFTFGAARSIVAAVVLSLGLWVWRKAIGRVDDRTPSERERDRKELWKGGLCCGTALAVASTFQQMGVGMTTAGKASFITALYIVLVPLGGLFLKKKVSPVVWISVAIAVAGLYLISVKEDFTISPGDFNVLVCAVCFTIHILLIDHFTQKLNGVELSYMQFFVCAAWCGLGMLLFEQPTVQALRASLLPILYVGVLSSGVAYTLQIVAQKGSNPAVVSLLLSLESVFGAVSGALILHERMTGRELLGCCLMLTAVVLSQLDTVWGGEKSK